MNHFVEKNGSLSDRLPENAVDKTIRLSSDELKSLELGLAKPTQLKDEKTGSRVATFFKNQILQRLKHLKGGSVTVKESGDDTELGNAGDHLQSDVQVFKEAFYSRIFWGGTIGSAESYMDGDWASSDLTSLIRIMIRNLDAFSRLERTWAFLKNRLYFLGHLLRRNSESGSRKNIHEHYDLGNDFYRLFLDPTMNYSSGIFRSPEMDDDDQSNMLQASYRKMETICRQLELCETDHVLEIGTGWGGLAIYMAETYGCRVTTCTISEEQYSLANQRVYEKGLEDRIEIKLLDYRKLEGKFDKIVSIEMIEAVGHQYYDEYFRICNRLLVPEGRLLLQAITIGEQLFDAHIRKVDFIRKYVFPGGCLPSVSALSRSIGRTTDMRMVHQFDLTPHYAKTLKFWRTQFLGKLEEVKSLGFDDSFLRLWHFYLAYCEAAFLERRVHCVHLMYAKPEFIDNRH